MNDSRGVRRFAIKAYAEIWQFRVSKLRKSAGRISAGWTSNGTQQTLWHAETTAVWHRQQLRCAQQFYHRNMIKIISWTVLMNFGHFKVFLGPKLSDWKVSSKEFLLKRFFWTVSTKKVSSEEFLLVSSSSFVCRCCKSQFLIRSELSRCITDKAVILNRSILSSKMHSEFNHTRADQSGSKVSIILRL